MPATTSAPKGMRDLLLVCAIGLFAGGLAAVAAGVTDASGTFVAAPIALAAHSGEDVAHAPFAFERGECRCESLPDRTAVNMSYAGRLPSSDGGGVAAVAPISPRERFLGETAIMRERARAGQQSDPRAFLLEAALASRMRGVGLFLAEDMPPLAGDK